MEIGAMGGRLTRVRHETRRRKLVLQRRTVVSPTILRLTFGGDLEGFTSLGFDDHIKLFLRDRTGNSVSRDYTPRRFDPDKGELDIEFAMHSAGVATLWAQSARPGDELEIGGPRGSLIVEDSFDWYALIGDETAFPAIARRLEELRPSAPAMVIVSVDEQADEVPLISEAKTFVTWVHRLQGETIEEVASEWVLPAGDGFIWIAGEAEMAKSVRQIAIDSGHPRQLIKAAGYWQRGTSGVHTVIDDEPVQA